MLKESVKIRPVAAQNRFTYRRKYRLENLVRREEIMMEQALQVLLPGRPGGFVAMGPGSRLLGKTGESAEGQHK